jgi:pseudouridine 5'-phosphatase
MQPSFTHVIFDLDGTLLDSEPLYTIAAERVCARYGARYTLELKRSIMGGDTQSGAERVVEVLSLPITPAAYIVEREQELALLWPELQPMAGAPALISALERANVPLAIATSGHRRVTEAKLAHQRFLHGIEVRVCGDDARLQRGKPAPDIFLLAAAELGAPPERCIVVEDSAIGVHAAVAAGMLTVALVDPRYGFAPEAFRGAARVIHELSQLDFAALGLRGAAGDGHEPHAS